MKKLYLLLIMLILVPIKVHAENTISLSCDDSRIRSDGEITCELRGHSDSDVTGFTGTINYDSDHNVSYDYTSPTSGWHITPSNNPNLEGSSGTSSFSLTANSNTSGNFNIARIKFIVNDNISITDTFTFTVSVSNAKYIGTENEDITLGDTEAGISLAAISYEEPEYDLNDRGLSLITVTNGELKPQFAVSTVSYVLLLASPETTTFKITATPNTSTDSVTFTNGDTGDTIDPNNITFTTNTGKSEMLINIAVGSDARRVDYQIIVAKPTKPDVDLPELATLVVGSKNVTIISGQTEYTVTLDDVTDYTLTATVKDENNYRFADISNPPLNLSGEQEVFLRIEPIDSTSGLKSVEYIIKIKSSKEPKTETPTKKTTTQKGGGGGGDTPENPYTGSASATIVAIILIASFVVSMYLYKKNINEYNH